MRHLLKIKRDHVLSKKKRDNVSMSFSLSLSQFVFRDITNFIIYSLQNDVSIIIKKKKIKHSYIRWLKLTNHIYYNISL